MADHTYPELPYRPSVAKKLGQNPESTELACKHLANTRGDGLVAIEPGDANKVETSHNTSEHARDCHKLQKADNPRDFVLAHEQTPHLQSTQVQHSDESKIETLEQRAEYLSDVLAEQEAQNEDLEAMIEEGRCELEGAKAKIIQLEARIQQLEEQTLKA